MNTALILVSHSADLANGAAELVGQMAPGVSVHPVGGRADGGIGTDYDRIVSALRHGLEVGGDVVVFADLGSAALTAETAREDVDPQRIYLANAPFVEGAVAAAVAAHSGANGPAVVSAARAAATMFTSAEEVPPPEGETADGALSVDLVIADPDGLHARPAAALARVVGQFDAVVTLNGAMADSVIALMGLALPGGATVHASASGPDAQAALDAIAAHLSAP